MKTKNFFKGKFLRLKAGILLNGGDMKNPKLIILLAGILLPLAGLFLSSGAFAAETLNGAGATFPYPVYSAWAYGYDKETGVQLNYQSIGSGGGQRQIISKTVDFGASDDPLEPALLKENNLLQFPAVIGGVVPVVNIPGVRPGGLRLDGPTLCGIFLGQIKFIDDPGIKALNPGLRLPHNAITVVHRSDGSGTTAIFTHYLAASCPDWKTKVGEGKAVSWPAGIGGKGNEGVANYVKRTPNSIGYVELVYAIQNRMSYVLMKNKAGAFVEPSIATFKSAAASGDFKAQNNFYTWLTNAPAKDAWPIAGATFILLNKDRKEANKKVVKFFDWAFKKGDKTAEDLTYVPLPAQLKDKVRAYWKANGIY
jgi:phosphate transport system substrate-binding protein